MRGPSASPATHLFFIFSPSWAVNVRGLHYLTPAWNGTCNYMRALSRARAWHLAAACVMPPLITAANNSPGAPTAPPPPPGGGREERGCEQRVLCPSWDTESLPSRNVNVQLPPPLVPLSSSIIASLSSVSLVPLFLSCFVYLYICISSKSFRWIELKLSFVYWTSVCPLFLIPSISLPSTPFFPTVLFQFTSSPLLFVTLKWIVFELPSAIPKLCILSFRLFSITFVLFLLCNPHSLFLLSFSPSPRATLVQTVDLRPVELVANTRPQGNRSLFMAGWHQCTRCQSTLDVQWLQAESTCSIGIS